MKIALLSFEYPPETGFGGIGTYTWYQARGLTKLGHEVHVIAGSLSSDKNITRKEDGIPVYRYKAKGLIMRFFQVLDAYQLWWTKNRLENAVSMYRIMRKLNRMHRYDAIEMPECGAEGFLVNHMIKENTFIKFHSPARLIMKFYDVRQADISLCSFVEQTGIRGAANYSSCSGFLADEVKNRMGIKRPIRVIPNGIDLDLFDRADQMDFRKKYNISRDRMMIVFSGRMERRKGIHLCREIAASVLSRYDVSFVFAGDDLFHYLSDDLLPYLKSKKLKGSVYAVGRLNQVEVRSCLCQSDIFLIPSLWENCPYSCLEAMAAGRAIVASNQGGMPELIRDGQNGLLAKSEKPGSYIACLERFINDDTLRSKMGAAARKTVETSFSDVYIAGLSADYYRNPGSG